MQDGRLLRHLRAILSADSRSKWLEARVGPGGQYTPGARGWTTMSKDTSANAIEAATVKAIKTDPVLFELIDLYVAAYSSGELQQTRLLAHVLRFDDFERFGRLIGRMDLRQKVEHFEAAKKYSERGPRIKERIAVFNGLCRPLRNEIAHDDFWIHNNSLYRSTLDRNRNAGPDNIRPKGETATAQSPKRQPPAARRLVELKLKTRGTIGSRSEQP